MKTTLTLADDHPFLLEGTKNHLQKFNYNVISTALDGNQAYKDILNHQPEIAVLDFDMPIYNGLEVALLCKQNKLKTKIIILTLHKQEAIIKEIGRTINGYILKDDASNELINCINIIQNGKAYISKNLDEHIYIPDLSEAKDNLTASEIKILRYLAKDYSSAEIAEVLFVSKRTVEKHRSNIIKKLGIKSSQNALLLWIQKNPDILNQ